MRIKIRHGSVKGKSTSGQKKPYKGFGRNRKGSKKESNGLGCKIVANRIKPKYSGKKGTIKQRADVATREPLNPNKPVRFGREQYWKRVTWLQDLGACQICGFERELDHPHHPHTGANRDDRYMINACIKCHRDLHEKGYSSVAKSLEECKQIGIDNNVILEKLEKEMV